MNDRNWGVSGMSAIAFPMSAFAPIANIIQLGYKPNFLRRWSVSLM